jgi:uncharacterized protein (DUF983 family)
MDVSNAYNVHTLAQQEQHMIFAAAIAALIVSALALGINIAADNTVNATIWGILVIVNTVSVIMRSNNA